MRHDDPLPVDSSHRRAGVDVPFRRVLKRKSKRKKPAPSEAKGSEGWPLILGSDLVYAATPPEVGAALAGAIRTALARRSEDFEANSSEFRPI